VYLVAQDETELDSYLCSAKLRGMTQWNTRGPHGSDVQDSGLPDVKPCLLASNC